MADLLDLDVIRGSLSAYLQSNNRSSSLVQDLNDSVDIDDISDKAKELFAEFITAALYARDGSRSFSADGIVVGKPKDRGDGSVSIELSFTKESIHRDSLRPRGKYKKGTDPYGGIVFMFTKGWHAEHIIMGEWKGHTDLAWSQPDREPDDFLQRAVDQFNAVYGSDSLRVELIGIYETESGD